MISVKITNDAIEYMSILTGMEPEDAEEELQTVIGLCKFKPAQQRVQADGACICPEFTVHPNPLHKECGVCGRPPRR